MVQSWNFTGIRVAADLILRRPQCLVPHVSVPNIAWVDFGALKAAGFKGLIFDKDNCLTAPYSLTIHPLLEKAWAMCKDTFGPERIAIFSNEPGSPDDKDSKKAIAIEKQLGVAVVRHKEKKPGGFGDAITYFPGCQPHELVMFGDRLFTDVAFGSLNGLFTVHSGILTEDNDNLAAKYVRRWEHRLLAKYQREKLQPVHHPALEGGVGRFVRESPLS